MQNQTDQLELSIDEAKARIAFSKDVLELVQNPLFQKVVTGKYITEGRIELVSRMANPSMQSETEIAYNAKALTAVSFLDNWLTNHILDGEHAESALHEAYKEAQLIEEGGE